MLQHDTHPAPIGPLHVAELARAAEVTPATVRYYSRIGLLRHQREPENGNRYFSSADRHRLRFIRRAQSLGLTIGNIKTVLESIDQGEVPCSLIDRLDEISATAKAQKQTSGPRRPRSHIARNNAMAVAHC